MIQMCILNKVLSDVRLVFPNTSVRNDQIELEHNNRTYSLSLSRVFPRNEHILECATKTIVTHILTEFMHAIIANGTS